MWGAGSAEETALLLGRPRHFAGPRSFPLEGREAQPAIAAPLPWGLPEVGAAPGSSGNVLLGPGAAPAHSTRVPPLLCRTEQDAVSQHQPTLDTGDRCLCCWDKVESCRFPLGKPLPTNNACPPFGERAPPQFTPTPP